MSSEVSSISLSLIETKAKLYLRLDHSNPISNIQQPTSVLDVVCWNCLCRALYASYIYKSLHIIFKQHQYKTHKFYFFKIVSANKFLQVLETLYSTIHWM